MKGRVTYEGVNAAVEELNVALVEKYTFLGGRMADLPNPKAKKRYCSLLTSSDQNYLININKFKVPSFEGTGVKGHKGGSFCHLRRTSVLSSFSLLEMAVFQNICMLTFMFRDSTHLKSETGRRSLLTILRFQSEKLAPNFHLLTSRHFGLVREIRGPGSIVRFAVTKTCQWMLSSRRRLFCLCVLKTVWEKGPFLVVKAITWKSCLRESSGHRIPLRDDTLHLETLYNVIYA